MTVAQLILELQYQPQYMEVVIIDVRRRFEEYRNVEIALIQPELADNFVALYINFPNLEP